MSLTYLRYQDNKPCSELSRIQFEISFNPLCPLLPYGYTTGIKHPVPDRVKQSFVIFDIWTLWFSWLGVRVPAWECPDVKNYKWWLNPVWHRMLYSCTPIWQQRASKGKIWKSL